MPRVECRAASLACQVSRRYSVTWSAPGTRGDAEVAPKVARRAAGSCAAWLGLTELFLCAERIGL